MIVINVITPRTSVNLEHLATLEAPAKLERFSIICPQRLVFDLSHIINCDQICEKNMDTAIVSAFYLRFQKFASIVK
jgi:hypothetical protein